MASCYWLIPFHLSGSNPARRIWIGGHREGGERSHRSQRRGSAAPRSLRWPEKRGDDAEGPGTRGRLGEARRVMASTRVALALEGEAPKRWRGAAAVAPSSGELQTNLGHGFLGAEPPVTGIRRGAAMRGRERSRSGRRGHAGSPGNAETRPRLSSTPTRNFSGLGARFQGAAEGKGCGGLGLYRAGNGASNHGLNRAQSEAKSTGVSKRMNR